MRLLCVLVLILADVVHLKNGGKVEGKVVDKGTEYEVQGAAGTITIPKAEVERVEKKPYTPPGPVLPAKKAARLGAPYAHPFLAFKIQLPVNWQRGKESGSAAVTFWGPKDQLYQPRIDLHVQTSAKELGEFVNAYKDAFRKGVKDVKFLHDEVTAVREKQAYQFIVSFTDADLPVTQQAIFTFITEGERKYVLSFNCTEAWFDRYSAAVDASMRSFRIFPLPNLGKEDKQRFLTRYNSGDQRFREGKLDEALADFQAAAELCPMFSDLRCTIAMIHMKQGRFADAEIAYRLAVEIDPVDMNGHFYLGICLSRQSKYAQAIEALKKAVELEPAYEPALTNLGAAYLGDDRDDLARQALEKAVQVDPESPTAHYNLGIVYERLDRPKDAERQYQDTLSADPKHAEAKKALERLRGKK